MKESMQFKLLNIETPLSRKVKEEQEALFRPLGLADIG